jgi:probable rRNA maturation factor
LKITVLNRQRKLKVGTGPLERFLGKAAGVVHPGDYDAMTVCIVSEQKMSSMNLQFRRKQGSTDVLSFQGDAEAGPDGERYLGDIVISAGTASRQARERGHSLAREIKILALHGYLHLLGYDHETDRGAMLALQERLEKELLGLPGRR